MWRISEEDQEPVACATRPRAGQRRKVNLGSNSVVDGGRGAMRVIVN